MQEVECLTDVAVIGSGAAGLTAAMMLAEGERTVYLIEKEPWLGGILPLLGDVEPGDEFTVKGNDKKGTLGKEIFIYVGEDMNLHTKIDTSCSKPIGPGLIYGDFEIIEGYSLKGGPLRSYGTD